MSESGRLVQVAVQYRLGYRLRCYAVGWSKLVRLQLGCYTGLVGVSGVVTPLSTDIGAVGMR